MYSNDNGYKHTQKIGTRTLTMTVDGNRCFFEGGPQGMQVMAAWDGLTSRHWGHWNVYVGIAEDEARQERRANEKPRRMIVHHMQRTGGMFYESKPVAEITAPAGMSKDDMLSLAWDCTQNIGGSWSRDDIEDNPDNRPECTRIGDLEVYDGKVYGLRSSMVGDVIEVYRDDDDYSRLFQIKGVGFKYVTRAQLEEEYYRLTFHNPSAIDGR